MRKAICTFLVALLAGLIGISPAWACINDSSTYQKEREFKSQYNEQENVSPAHEQGVDIVAWGATGTGLVLLIGAVAICLPRRNRLEAEPKPPGLPPSDE